MGKGEHPAPSTSPESKTLSADLKSRGFKFVGETVIYAHMQAAGMVNDHDKQCFRRRECSSCGEISRIGVVNPPLSRGLALILVGMHAICALFRKI